MLLGEASSYMQRQLEASTDENISQMTCIPEIHPTRLARAKRHDFAVCPVYFVPTWYFALPQYTLYLCICHCICFVSRLGLETMYHSVSTDATRCIWHLGFVLSSSPSWSSSSDAERLDVDDTAMTMELLQGQEMMHEHSSTMSPSANHFRTTLSHTCCSCARSVVRNCHGCALVDESVQAWAPTVSCAHLLQVAAGGGPASTSCSRWSSRALLAAQEQLAQRQGAAAAHVRHAVGRDRCADARRSATFRISTACSHRHVFSLRRR